MELRCPRRLLFGIIDGKFIEVKCRSRLCGAAESIVVLHRFSLETGECVETRKYKEPRKGRQ